MRGGTKTSRCVHAAVRFRRPRGIAGNAARRLVALVAVLAALSVPEAASAAAPPSVTATTPTSVSLSWVGVTGAASYRVDWPVARAGLTGVSWVGRVNTTATTNFVDRTIPCGASRTYTVVPLASNGAALASLPAVTATSAPCPPPVPASGHDVFVQYYPWWGVRDVFDVGWLGWRINEYVFPRDSINADFYPLGGLYSVRDGALLDRQMQQMKQNGITVIVYTWGTGRGGLEDERAPMILQYAAKHGLKVAFLLDAYAGRSAATLASDISYLYDRYGASPAFYRTTRPGLNQGARTAGQGLFFLWAPHLNCYARYGPPCGQQVSASYWASAADAVHSSARGGIIIANGNFDLSHVQAAHLDGVFLYGLRPPRSAYEYRERAVSWPKNAWYIPHAMPGFNNLCSWASFAEEDLRHNGAVYDDRWAGMLSGPALYAVGVTSWNEWHEGTQIEPALYGYRGNHPERCHYSDYEGVGSYGYLYKTRRWAAKLATRPVPEAYAGRAQISADLGPQYADDGLYQLDVGDGKTKTGTVAGRGARSPLSFGATVRYVYFAVENQFAWKTPSGTKMTVAVTLLDQGSGQLRMHYDGNGGIKWSPTVHTLTNTGTWKTYTFSLPDVHFASRLNRYTDFRLITPNQDTWVDRVTVTRG